MEYEFRDWLACPACDERTDVSILAHDADVVLECYECGLISEFIIGADVTLQNLDTDAIDEVPENRTNE